ncbi:MAG: hypothetical protein ACLR0P_03550 [Oscillospiraceae bacterium]
MIKIFRCECRRLLCNKFFIGLLAVLLFYAGQVFYAVALPGVAHTAPFSPWSFGAYLGRLLPLVWVGALFFLTFFTSARERRAAVLTAATPADPRRYALASLRCRPGGGGSALPGGAGPGRPALCPPVRLDGLGLPGPARPGDPGAPSGVRPGQRLAAGPPAALAALCVDAPPLALAALPLPEALGLWNGGLCTSYPLTLGMLDPAFSLPAAAWAVQGLLLAAGVLLLLVAGKGKKVYNQ